MAPVDLLLAEKKLFVGSFTELTVVIDPASGLTLDDLDLVVPSGLAGGRSHCRGAAGFDPERPVFLLLAGHEPGGHVVEARAGAGGPSSGGALPRPRHLGRRAGSAGCGSAAHPTRGWPGRPGAAGRVDPRTSNAAGVGTRRIAILFVDTSSRRYTTTPRRCRATGTDGWTRCQRSAGRGPVTRSSAACSARSPTTGST